MAPAFCVIGSINMDLVARVDRFPRPGETRTGAGFGTFPGGKGANQAVALARLDADVRMFGKLGDDVFGQSYLETFRREAVDTADVEVVPRTSTGVAVIEVESAGENTIVIVPGANGLVDSAYIDAHLEQIATAQYALFQLEIPFDTVEHAMEAFRRRGGATILDPAPAPPSGLSGRMLRGATYLTPNENEARELTGITVADIESADAAARILRDRGAETVVIKAGAHGAYVTDDRGTRTVPGFSVKVADTTAAGDAFNAGLAYGLGEGRTVDEAVRFANAVGALTCTEIGAQSAMPSRADAAELSGG
ncbi:MAG: ribokinase [Spirochaetaceae bacterium]